jgi:hypothetical protein
MEWLNNLSGIEVLRQKVEQLDKKLFLELEENDILFFDSSHMIRPQGDVLFEYLEILPGLRSGVLVHTHDIFTPRDYPYQFLINEVKLLEAFMSCSSQFEIIIALNYLCHQHPVELSAKFPILGERIEYSEPGSFWIRKVV